MDNEEILLNFMEVSNLQIEEARRRLHEAGGSFELAIQQYYDSQQGIEEVTPSNENISVAEEDEVRPVIPRAYDVMVVEQDNRRVSQLCRVGTQFISNFRDLKREMEIQEEIARGQVPKKKCLEDIFRNPVDITSNLEFSYAKIYGNQTGKWLAILINNESFESLSVNRDIFNEPLLKVKKILKQNFVFLRKNSNDEEGLTIMRLYNLFDHTIPIFLIIDSLTGELKKNFGNCSELNVKNVTKELKKYTSKDKQLVYNSSYEDSDEEDTIPPLSFAAASTSLLLQPSTSKSTQSRPIETKVTKCYESDDEESFASLSSIEGDEIECTDEKEEKLVEVKVLDSSDELEKTDDGPETNILLKLHDENHKFKYPSNRTVGQLINYIYRNYLIQTGIYVNQTKRFSLFSKIHNKCLTNLDSSATLVEAKIHPSIVLMHNTLDKD